MNLHICQCYFLISIREITNEEGNYNPISYEFSQEREKNLKFTMNPSKIGEYDLVIISKYYFSKEGFMEKLHEKVKFPCIVNVALPFEMKERYFYLLIKLENSEFYCK